MLLGVIELNDLDGVIEVIYSHDNLSELEVKFYAKTTTVLYRAVNLKFDKIDKLNMYKYIKRFKIPISKNDLALELEIKDGDAREILKK